MRVLKFGGSSLADAERFLRVADIAVNTHGQSQVALVLSAPAKVTNHLVALVEQTSRGMDASATLFEINGIFSRLLAGLKAAYPALDDKALQARLTSELDQVERLMQGIRLLGLCPDNVQARILSRGENLLLDSTDCFHTVHFFIDWLYNIVIPNDSAMNHPEFS